MKNLEVAAAGMVGTEPAASGRPARKVGAREVHCAPRLGRFLALAGQLALLELVFNLYHTLEKPIFAQMSGIVFGAFLIHYWLPFRHKEPFWVAVSIIGGFFLVPPRVAEFLIVAGLAFFLILRSRLPHKYRVLLLTVIFGALIYCCATKAPHIPPEFYPVFGGIFMFRIIIYAYDIGHSRQRAQLLPFLSYFFILPNYLISFFPVLDFQTMRRTYCQRDINDIAQQGIHWMARGTVQLLLYKLVVYLNDAYLPDRVTTPGALVSTMILTYLLYLNVSGQFHIVIGMLHLFGYDLPETHRNYLLARSVMDLWRRINIYWKDFMVKMVYFPVYFRLRRKGDVRAQVIATAAVFVVTWALHSYQFFWLKGQLDLSWTDAIFWIVIGTLVIVNVLIESRKKSRRTDGSGGNIAVHGLQILGTFALITTLWSFWSAPTVSAWVYMMTRWTRGS